MLEHKNTNVMNTKVSVEKVDLLHFDPFNPNGHCCCGGHGGHHCCGKHHHNHDNKPDEISDLCRMDAITDS